VIAPLKAEGAAVTSTQTIEQPKTADARTDAGGHDRFAHYFRKSDIELAYLEGQAIRALCGKVDVPLKDPNKYPVCPECRKIFDSLRE
jgi:hypothetical protein